MRGDGSRQILASKCDNVKVKAGDLLLFDTWGAGGWGDPLQREPAKVLADVRKSLVSVDGARRYGVVVAGDAVDEVATRTLRATMAQSREPIGLFNRGGTLDELKQRCLEETGLPAPATPVWT